MTTITKLRGLILLLGLALLPLLVPNRAFAVSACVSARFTDYRDFGCKLPADPWGNLSGKPANQSSCPGGCPGMPRWWVSEPNINLWVADEPLSYPTSSGQTMTFRWTHRQRQKMPDIYTYNHSATGLLLPAGREDIHTKMRMVGTTNITWSHSWLSDIVFWSWSWETNFTTSSPTPPLPTFYQYEALHFRADGGIGYYHSVTNAEDSFTKISIQPCSPSGVVTVGQPVEDANHIVWGDQTNGVKLVYPDGSQDRFGFAYLMKPHASQFGSTARAFLTEKIDPQGRVTRLGYEHFSNGGANSGYRLRYVVDSDGRINTFEYRTNFAGFYAYVPPNPWALKQVTDPYGRKAEFGYDFVSGIMTSITDAAGLTSSFQYQIPLATNTYFACNGFCLTNIVGYNTNCAGWITNLNTPYGTTDFRYHQEQEAGAVDEYKARAILVTEPNNTRQLFYYWHSNNVMSASIPTVTNVSGSVFDNGASGDLHHEIYFRNTFHWGPRQFAALSVSDWSNLGTAISSLTSNDCRKAQLSHWLLSSDDLFSVTDSISAEREPSPDAAGVIEGAWTFYDYAGKNPTLPERSGPDSLISTVARLLPDGSSQYSQVQNNLSGFPTVQWETYTQTNGAVGLRTNFFAYSGIDVTSISNGFGQSSKLVYNATRQVTFTTNALNEVTSFNYSGSGIPKLDTLTLPSGQTATFTYYTSNSTTANGGFLKQIAWSPGETISFGYDKGLPKVVTNNSTGLIVNFTWDDLLRPTGASFPDGSYTSNRYDKLDLAATRDRLGNWTYFGYDANQHLTDITNANHAVTHLTWCGCGALESVTNALGGRTAYIYDNLGRATTVTYPDNTSATYFYDSAGRLTNAVDSANRSMKLGYNSQGLATTISNAYGRVSEVVYDALNRPWYATDAEGLSVTNSFDLLGRLTKRTWPDGFGETFVYRTNGLFAYTNRNGDFTHYARDAAGRVTAVTNANKEVTRFVYNAAGQITDLYDGRNQHRQWGYDEYGRTRTKTDALSRQTTWDYNANGWLTTRHLPQSGDTTYLYDAVGNLTNVTYNGGTSPISYAYDALSRLTNMLDAVGVTKFTYTAASQLSSEDGPWANDVITNSYTEGLLTTMAVGTWSQSYAYDLAARLTSLASPAGTFGYGYKSGVSALVTSTGLPNHGYITNRYDTLSRLDQTALVNRWGNVLDGYGYMHDPLGLRTNITRHFGLTNSTVALGYDDIGQLTSWSAKDPGNVTRFNEQLGWKYDAAGNLNYRTNNALLQTFAVDNADQLTGVSRAGTFTVTGNTPAPASSVTVNGASADRYQDFTFAGTNNTLADGNNTFSIIAQRSTGGNVTNDVTVNLPDSITLLYDLNGNLTNDGLRSFSYDAETQLVTNWVAGAWKNEFVYDGFGRRRITREYGWQGGSWVRTNEIRYVCDGMLPVQERDTNNNVSVAYTRGLSWGGGIGGMLARTDSAGTAFYHADGSGNITALMDERGDVVARYLYNPFGKQIGQWGTLADANRYRFSSKEISPNSGFYYYGFRFYEPNLQRWLNQDPIGEAGGVNLHQFVENDPINGTDDWGMQRGPTSTYIRGVSPNPLINLEIEAEMRAISPGRYRPSRYQLELELERMEQQMTRHRQELEREFELPSTYRPNQQFRPLLRRSEVKNITDESWGEAFAKFVQRNPINYPMTRMEYCRQLGREGEIAGGTAGPRKAIESITGTAARRFPDRQTATELIETKNVRELRAPTDQLRDYTLFAQRETLQFTLQVRENTIIRPTAEQFLQQNRVNVVKILPPK